MSSQRRDESSKLRWPDEIDEIFGRANPNPRREGCPARDELIALSRRQRPIHDPGYVHLTQCSPCYVEVRALQEARTVEWRAWWTRVAAAALVVIAIALGVWFMISRRSLPMEVQAQLDLRPYPVLGETPPERELPPLPPGRLSITMLLPVTFEPGAYEVQLLDSELRSRASALGTATSANGVTSLQTTLDLTSIASGSYQLALRRTGEDWQFFPVKVR